MRKAQFVDYIMGPAGIGIALFLIISHMYENNALVGFALLILVMVGLVAMCISQLDKDRAMREKHERFMAEMDMLSNTANKFTQPVSPPANSVANRKAAIAAAKRNRSK